MLAFRKESRASSEKLPHADGDIFNIALEMKSINIHSQANQICFEDQGDTDSILFPLYLGRACQTLHLKCIVDGAGGRKGPDGTGTEPDCSLAGWTLIRS